MGGGGEAFSSFFKLLRVYWRKNNKNVIVDLLNIFMLILHSFSMVLIFSEI